MSLRRRGPFCLSGFCSLDLELGGGWTGIPSLQRVRSRGEGENREKAKVKGAGSPCEEAQTGKEISRSVIIHGLRKQPRLEHRSTGPVGRGPKRLLTTAQPGWVTVKWYGGGETRCGDRLSLQTSGSEDLRVSSPSGSVLGPFWARSGAGETQPLERKRCLSENQEAPRSLALSAVLVNL